LVPRGVYFHSLQDVLPNAASIFVYILTLWHHIGPTWSIFPLSGVLFGPTWSILPLLAGCAPQRGEPVCELQELRGL
jgi:hypothetical protein